MNLRRSFSVMNKKTIPMSVQNAQYAVRGAVAIRAGEIKKEMAAGKKFKFDKLVPIHSGNPQALGQPPITFGREVLSILFRSQMWDSIDHMEGFSEDAMERAAHYRTSGN